jgi:hypothetical protein
MKAVFMAVVSKPLPKNQKNAIPSRANFAGNQILDRPLLLPDDPLGASDDEGNAVEIVYFHFRMVIF